MESHAAGQLHDDLEILIFMYIKIVRLLRHEVSFRAMDCMQLFKLPA